MPNIFKFRTGQDSCLKLLYISLFYYQKVNYILCIFTLTDKKPIKTKNTEMNKILQSQLMGGFCWNQQVPVNRTFINVFNLTS